MREHEDNADRLFRVTPEDGPALRWLKTQARYVRARLSGRAMVTAWLPGGRALSVEFVFAVRDETVVLQGHLSDGAEVHFSTRPDEVLLEMRPAPKDSECTVFAVIGVSRTPQPLIDCSTEEEHEPGEGHHH